MLRVSYVPIACSVFKSWNQASVCCVPVMFWFSWLVDKCAPLIDVVDADEFNREEVAASVEWDTVSSVFVRWGVVFLEYNGSFDVCW